MWTRKGVLIHLFWPRLRIGGNARVFGVLLITDYRLPITDYRLPITDEDFG
ncbi:hypothetical protein JZ785_22435 [Alicyclobacillus curvatus]|nr:hypothetical protein JZ785_22435 [Alicyclobacillus curvatus]